MWSVWNRIVVVSAAFVTFAEADFLNDYLDGKIFGDEPGPCPDFENRCTGDATNLPQNVQDIDICLTSSVCRSIGDLVKEGEMEIWDLQCQRISVGDINLVTATSSNTEIVSDITVVDFGLSCTFRSNVNGLFLDPGVAGITVLMTLRDVEISFPVSGDQGVVDLGLRMNFGSDNFAGEMPNDVEIPVDQCELGTDLGLDLTFEKINNLRLCADFLFLNLCASIGADDGGLGEAVDALLRLFNIDAIVSAVIRILEGLIGGIICGIISQFAKLNNGNDGLFNELLDELKEYVDDLADTPEIIFDEDDFDLSTVASPDEIEASFNLVENDLFEIISVAFNIWLGGESNNPDFDLVINELVNQITGGDGAFEADLADLGANPEFLLPLDVANVTVRVDQAAFTGIDSFTKFEILQNAFDPDDPNERASYTVENNFQLTDLTLDIQIYVNFARGDWVTGGPGANTESDFSFTFSIALESVEVEATSLLLFNLDELNRVQVGQIVQIPDKVDLTNLEASLRLVRQCVAPAFYALHFGDLELSIGRVGEARVLNFDGDGLSDLISEAVELGGDLLRGALSAKLPGIARGLIREELNIAVKDNFTDPGRQGIDLCPEWVASGPLDEATRLNITGDLLELLSTAIDSSIGGDPIVDSGTDINELFDTLLTYFSETSDTFPLIRVDQGSWRATDDLTESLRIQAYGESRADEFLQVRGFSMRNFNSIYKLQATQTPVAGPYGGLLINLGIGGNLDPDAETKPAIPFTVSLPLIVETALKGSEEFTFDLGIEESVVTFAITEVILALNHIEGLYIEDAVHIPCVLSALKSLKFDDSYQTLTTEAVYVQLEWDDSSDSSSKLAQGLRAVGSEIDQGSGAFPSPDGTFIPLLNVLLGLGFRTILDEVELLPSYYENLTSANCRTEPDPLDEIELILNPFPNFTETFDECTVDVDFEFLRGRVTELEDEVVYDETKGDEVIDLEQNVALDILQGLLAGVFSESLGDGLVRIANSTTDSIFSSILRLRINEVDEPVVDLLIPLEALGLRYADDSVASGFVLDAGTLVIRSASEVLNNLELLKPVGTFTTNSIIQFLENEPVDVVIESYLEVDEFEIIPGAPAGSKLREDVDITFTMTDFTLDMNLITAFNPVALGELSLGHFLRADADQTLFVADTALECGARAFYENGLRIAYMFLEIGQIDTFRLVSRNNVFLSEGFELLFEAVAEILVDFYKEAVTPIAQNCLVEFANNFFKELQAESLCPDIEDVAPPPLSGEDVLFRFNTSKDWEAFQNLQNDFFLDDNYAGLNSLLAVVIGEAIFLEEGSDDAVVYENLPFVFAGIDYGTFDFSIRNLKVINPGFTGLRIGQPETVGRIPDVTPENVGYSVRTIFNTLMATDERPEGDPFGIEIDLRLNARELFLDDDNLNNDIRVQFNLNELAIDVTTLFEINMTEALKLQFSNLNTLDRLPCILIPLEAFEIMNLDLKISSLTVDGECLEDCELPFLNEIGDIRFSTPNGEDLASALERAIVFISEYLTEREAQRLIDAQLATVADTCDELLSNIDLAFGAPIDPPAVSNALALVLLGIIGFASAGTLCMYPAHKVRRKKRLLAAVSRTEKSLMTRDEVATENEIKGIIDGVKLSMMSLQLHPSVSRKVKLLVPALLFSIVALSLIAGTLVNLFDVTVQLTVLGADTVLVRVVPITLESLINILWDELGFLLPFLLGVVTWGVPTLQVMGLSAIWYAPTTVFATKSKRKLLILLQLSLQFCFVILLIFATLCSALYTVVDLRDYRNLAFISEDLFALELNMIPETGIVLIVFTALIMLCTNHLVSFYLEKSVNYTNMTMDAKSGIRRGSQVSSKAATAETRLIEHRFSGRDRSGYMRKVNPCCGWLIAVGSIVSMLVILVGCFVPVIRFDVVGLAGIALEEISLDSPTIPADEPLQIKEYSLADIGGSFSTVPKLNAIGFVRAAFLQIVFFLVFVFMPVVQPLVLAATLTFKMSLRGVRKILVVQRIMLYWNCLLLVVVVFLLIPIVVAELIEVYINFVSEQAIGDDFCYSLESTLQLLVPDPSRDAKCLSVLGSILTPFAILAAGTLGQVITNLLFIYLANAAVADRYYAAYRNQRGDAKPPQISVVGRFVLKLVTMKVRGSPRMERISQNISTPSLHSSPGGRQGSPAQQSTPNANKGFLGSLFKGPSEEQVEEESLNRIAQWEKRYGTGKRAPPSDLSIAQSNPAFETRSNLRRSDSNDSVEV